MADDKSVDTGSQPEDEKVDSSTTEDAKENSSTSEKPWSKDPRFREDNEAYKLGKSVKGLLEANGLEDIEELKDLVQSGSKVKGKQVDLDNIDSILEKAKKADQWEKYWRDQRELQQRGMETPEQTIARLTQQHQEREKQEEWKRHAEKEKIESQRAIQAYENEVVSQLESIDTSPEAREILAWALGKGNECNEINITDRRAVKKLVSDGHKKFETFVKTVKEQAIKDYIKGKEEIPKVPSASGTVATTKPEPPKGLKGLRSAFLESMMRKT